MTRRNLLKATLVSGGCAIIYMTFSFLRSQRKSIFFKPDLQKNNAAKIENPFAQRNATREEILAEIGETDRQEIIAHTAAQINQFKNPNQLKQILIAEKSQAKRYYIFGWAFTQTEVTYILERMKAG